MRAPTIKKYTYKHGQSPWESFSTRSPTINTMVHKSFNSIAKSLGKSFDDSPALPNHKGNHSAQEDRIENQ